MIIVDEKEPVGELPPPFPPRNVVVKDDDDVRKFYDLKREIGRGRFGTVYLVNDKETGQKFAAKFVNTKRNQDRANVEREIEIMKALNAEKPHPRLIQLYDAFDMDKEMCLVLEIVDGGELFERVIDDDFVLTEKACTIFVRQICEGVEFIHSKNILHLDMKPENILCLSREGNRIKICDFGLARKYDPRKKLQVLFGTPEFVAPEVVNFEPISFGTDMWSIGVITYVLLSGLSPFMGHNYVETMTNVTKNKYDFEDEAFKSVSEDAKDFIQKLLVLDKSLRMTPGQCQHHGWLKRPPANTLRRSLCATESESEEETEEEEVDHEDLSIEEKIVQEEKENEKDKIKIKDELERQQAEARKKEEELELTKKQLKDFVERWNSHPNSPYLIGTPISLDLQRAVKTGGWDSRASFTSVVVGPPSAPGDISDQEDDDDDLDIIGQDDFIHYTIEPQKPLRKQLSPEEVAKELGEKLTLLQQDEMAKNKENEVKNKENEVKNNEKEAKNKVNEVNNKANEATTSELQKAEVELQNKANKEKSTTKDAKIPMNDENEPRKAKTKPSETKKKTEVEIIKTGEKERSKKPVESKRKTVEAPKQTNESKLEKHKKAYEERKRKMKSLEEEKKKEAASSNELQKKTNIDDSQKEAVKKTSTTQAPELLVLDKPEKNNTQITDRTRPEEQKKTDNEIETSIDPNSSQEIQTRRETSTKSKDQSKHEEELTASETLKKISEKPMSDYKKEYEEYLKMVSNVPKSLDEPQIQEDQKKIPDQKLNVSQKATETKTPTRKLNVEEKSTNLNVVKKPQNKIEADLAKKSESDKKLSVGQKKPFSQRFRFGKENTIKDTKSPKQGDKQTENDNESSTLKTNESRMEEHKKLYQEYLKMVGETQNQVDIEPNKSEIEKNANVNDNKPLDHRLLSEKENNISETSREPQRKISDAYKTKDSQRKSSAKTIENMPKEPLRRPEIIALQNEELGGSIPRQRKKSIPPRFEMGGEALVIDRASRGSTPSSPGRDGGNSPKYDRYDTFDYNSRGPTPTKQLKKQPSRDVPLQAKEDSYGTPVRQRPSRDVPIPYSSLHNDDVFGADGQLSRDLTPIATPCRSRKASYEERSPSRGTREGTPVNRRPSRDVPLTPTQLDRLSAASGLAATDQSAEPQAWPDLIVVPQGIDAEECNDFKDSLDVPVATLVKSPSGTLSVPGVTVSQHDKDGTLEIKNESDPAYVPNNKLVAWILDIGNVQNQHNVTNFTTSDRVSQWESRDGSPRPTSRSSRDVSPRTRDRSPLPLERHRDRSPIPNKQPVLYPLSREPSTISLKSSTSSDNLFIQTPWGAMKRSPSRTNLSKSPSFEVPSIILKESQTAQNTTEDLSQYSQSDDHMSVDSSTRSPSPKMIHNQFTKQDTLEISEMKDFQSCSRLSGELPPKPPEKCRVLPRNNREDNLNFYDTSRHGDTKSHTLPRPSRLLKENSIDTINKDKSLTNERKIDNKKRPSIDTKKTNETGNTDNLKRKSRFPPSPNQKKKLGPLLFSAQDRISQFEQTPSSNRVLQRPITRTRSNMVFSKTTEKLHPSDSLMENRIMCDENKNTKSSLLSSKSNDKTHVKFITNKLLDKVGKSTGILPAEVIQNVDSVNNNVGNAK